jgi:hypothetical protein
VKHKNDIPKDIKTLNEIKSLVQKTKQNKQTSKGYINIHSEGTALIELTELSKLSEII